MYDLPKSQETLMQRPFELSSEELRERLEEMVQATISDLVSEFLLMPMGSSFIKYPNFRAAYEVLKRHTAAFTTLSELVGEVMENAVEDQLRRAGITYRKTKRAERLPGFGQTPDFCIPDEVAPVVIIEAKITSDDGTARDKVARIKELETQRNQHVASGRARYEVVACIDGRGFRERREDMRQMLLRLDGKVFTTASLDQLVMHTRLKEFVTTAQHEQGGPKGP